MEDEPRLADLSWPRAQELLSRRPVGLLPVGAIEAHGPHLPLETDLIIAEAMAKAGAVRLRRRGIPSLILPAIPYGVSFVGTCFPGTSPADPGAVTAYVGSLLVHLAAQGYRAVCLCNAHLEPAHIGSLQEAAAYAAERARLPVAVLDKREPRWASRLSTEFERGARHAGSYETSIVLAAKPEAVDRERVRALPPVWVDLPQRLRDGARTFAEAGGTQGYFGDPARATVAEGQRLLQELGAIIADLVVETLAAVSNE